MVSLSVKLDQPALLLFTVQRARLPSMAHYHILASLQINLATASYCALVSLAPGYPCWVIAPTKMWTERDLPRAYGEVFNRS